MCQIYIFKAETKNKTIVMIIKVSRENNKNLSVYELINFYLFFSFSL